MNVLFESLKSSIWRDNKEYYMEFKHGERVSELRVIGDAAGKQGTSIRFLPSIETFSQTVFDGATPERRFRELAFLNSGVHFEFRDERDEEPYGVIMHYEGGIVDYGS